MSTSTKKGKKIQIGKQGLFDTLKSKLEETRERVRTWHWIPQELHYHIDKIGDKRAYHLTPIQRIFVLMEDPSSSILGQIISMGMVFVIVLSVGSYVAESIASCQYIPDTCDNPVCEGKSTIQPSSLPTLLPPPTPHSISPFFPY